MTFCAAFSFFLLWRDCVVLHTPVWDSTCSLWPSVSQPRNWVVFSVSSDLSYKSPFYYWEGQAYKSSLWESKKYSRETSFPLEQDSTWNTVHLDSHVSAHKPLRSCRIIHTLARALWGSQGGNESKFSTLWISFFVCAPGKPKAEAFHMNSSSKFWALAGVCVCFVAPSHVKVAWGY